jgi:hypothetical protein
MADRIEYEGVPLPSGLPGFGGGTVEVLILPGFNTVVAPLQFGPVVDAVNAIPPDPTPPTGSNPDDPTDQVVDPGPPPPANGLGPTISRNFCEDCTDQDNVGQNVLITGYRQTITCTPCNSNKEEPVIRYSTVPAGVGPDEGVYWDGASAASLRGTSAGRNWTLSETELTLGGDSGGVSLNESQLALGVGGGLETFYQAGPTIQGPDGKEYTPQALDVCEGGQTKTWYVLAYKQP